MKNIFRNKGVILSIVLIILVFALSGCATIVNQGKQDVNINSLPSGATIQITDNNGIPIFSGVTPQVVTLARGSGFFQAATYNVSISKPGYAPVSFRVSGTSQIGVGWYLVGNFFSWGFLGWLIVDPATGAMWDLNPSSLSPELQQQIGATKSNSGQNNLTIVLKDQVPAAAMVSAKPLNAQAK
ncbi:MAG: hypothetical protein NTX05_08410 [Fusobacteria bacterium]|nr:hypothetical protein [Fusobacteriota bacterium]